MDIALDKHELSRIKCFQVVMQKLFGELVIDLSLLRLTGTLLLYAFLILGLLIAFLTAPEWFQLFIF